MQPTLYVMIVMKDKHDMKFDLMATIWDDLIDLQWHIWTNMDKAFLHFSSHVIMMSSCLFSPFPPRLCQILASVAHVDAQLAEMALWLGEGVARGQKASNASVQEVPRSSKLLPNCRNSLILLEPWWEIQRKISKNHGSWGWTLWTRPECQAHSKFDIGRSCQSHRIYIYMYILLLLLL